MKTILKNTIVFMLVFFLILSLPFSSFAATKKGNITITLEDKENNPLNDISVKICHIAKINNTGYSLTKPFKNSDISITKIIKKPNESSAKAVAKYINKKSVPAISATSKNGKIYFSDLDLGLWFIYTESNSYTFSPYFIFLPYESAGKLSYNVFSNPKIEDNNSDTINISIIKKWNDSNNAPKKRPNSISVELLCDNKVIEKIQLNELNSWCHTFTNLPKNKNYSIIEEKVNDYKASYDGDAVNGFVITNTYIGDKLPQTGQKWWPIILIAIADIGFIILGIYEIGVKRNGKKK